MEICSKRSRGYTGGDRLSNLPDCLLHSILSQLKARQVVQTCALSRRWRHLWLEVPCLDITSGEFRIVRSAHGSPQEANGIEQVAEFSKFEDFVDNLLFHRSAVSSSSELDALRLHIHDNLMQHTNYGRWIRRGLKCSPATLDVSHGGDYGIILLPPLAATGTHRLTKLRLDRVIPPLDFEEKLSSRLPVLEDLEIKNGGIGNRCSQIASNSLKNLTLDSYSCVTYHGDVHGGFGTAFAVVAPRLASLHLVLRLCSRFDGPYRDITLGEAPSLVQASIRLLNKEGLALDVTPDTYSYFLRTICKLLNSMSNVTRLELSGFQQTMVAEHGSLAPPPTAYKPQFQFQTNFYATTNPFLPNMPSNAYVPGSMLQAILDEENDGLPMFPNLRTLIFDECEIGRNMATLCRFLHNTPAIEKLTMQHCKFVDASERKNLQTNKTKLSTASKLKLVQIKYRDNDYHDPTGRSIPAPRGGGTRQLNKIKSMLKGIVPATTMIRATKTN